jgi:hypothetical protein
MVVLSDKTSRFHPRHVVLKPTQADEFEMPVRCEWISHRPPSDRHVGFSFVVGGGGRCCRCSRRLVALLGHGPMSDLSPLCAQLRTLIVGLHHRSRASFRRLPCVSLRSGLNGQRHQQTGFHDLVGRRRERARARSDPRAHSGREARPCVATPVQRRPPAFRVRYRRRGQDRRLVPNAHEQAALARVRALRDEGKTFRDIADAWVSEFGMSKFDAKSIQRMLSRAVQS